MADERWVVSEVAHHEEIEVSIPIGIEGCRRGGPSRVLGNAPGLADIHERAISLAEPQGIGSPRREVAILDSIAIEVGDSDPHAVATCGRQVGTSQEGSIALAQEEDVR